jgi:hypothetical protein
MQRINDVLWDKRAHVIRIDVHTKHSYTQHISRAVLYKPLFHAVPNLIQGTGSNAGLPRSCEFRYLYKFDPGGIDQWDSYELNTKRTVLGRSEVVVQRALQFRSNVLN